MKFEFTPEMLKAIIHGNSDSDKWYEALVEILPKYDIDTKERVAGFLAQCAHESADFKSLEENLNYSESALNAVFGRYFGSGSKKRDAAEYALHRDLASFGLRRVSRSLTPCAGRDGLPHELGEIGSRQAQLGAAGAGGRGRVA